VGSNSMERKKIFLWFIVFVCLFFIQLVSNGALFSQEESLRETYAIGQKFEKTIDFTHNGFIEILNTNGDIQIKSWDKSEVYISVNNRRRRSDEIELDVIKRNGKLMIEVIYPENRWYKRSYPYTVNLLITIPEKSDLDVESMNGRVEIFNVSGEINAESMNDEVLLENVKGEIRAESMNSLVTLMNVSGKVDCESMNRGVRIENSQCLHINAESMNGKVYVETTIEPQGNYNCESINGDVILLIPADSRATVRAEAPRNRFRSDFDELLDREDRRRDRDWEWGTRRFSGRINGGGARITLSTTNGEIDIRKK